MRVPAADEITIAALLKTGEYSSARLRYVLVHEQGRTNLFRGAIELGSSAIQERVEDYGVAVFVERELGVENVIPLFRAMRNGESLEKVGIPTNPGQKYRVQVDDHGPEGWWPTPIGKPRIGPLPSRVIQMEPEGGISWPRTPLFRSDLPLVANIEQKIADWTGIQSGRHGNIRSGVAIVFPDPRGGIAHVSFGDEAARVRLAEGTAPQATFELKAEVRIMRSSLNPTVDSTEDGFRIALPREWNELTAVLFDKESGDVVDWLSVHPSTTGLLGGTDVPEVSWAFPEQQLLQSIASGESESLEFKENRGDGVPVIQSVVAFANSGGGTILVGVRNDGTIAGTSVSEDQSRIANWIEEKCDPPLTVKFTTVRIEGKDVLAIQVPAGDNPPYQHREKHIFYVRRGATDRPARRAELDELYKRSHRDTRRIPGWG